MTALQLKDKVIPGEPKKVGRDPESSKFAENQIILDPPPKAAGDDEYDSTNRGGFGASEYVIGSVLRKETLPFS
jgi:hypothetical protein